MGRRRRTAALALPLLSAAPFLGAQEEPERTLANPPLLAMRRGPLPMPAGLAPPAAAGEAVLDLDVVYTEGRIWNPAEGRYDAVRLRSYQGAPVDPSAPYVSPTIEVRPGDTIRATLHNKLPADPKCLGPHGSVNVPHCFNGTNLHTHGLWVNPGGNGDNVLISINPGVSFQYEYKIPPDHPAGTFWYHTHRHGSTALQVSSGMGGALIVRGQRPPTATAPGDLDALLKPIPGQPFTQRVLVMQQIQYACRDAGGKVKTNPDGTYRCDPGDTGAIESYDLFGPSGWRNSGRFTSINGQVLPVFAGARAGQVEWWRLVHAGVRDTINVEIRKARPDRTPLGRLSAAASDAYVGGNCTGEPLRLHLVAADGLTTAAAVPAARALFQPAYRWDALVVFPEPGLYCVIDAAAPATGSVGQEESPRQLLGLVRVAAGQPVTGDLTAYLARTLLAAAARNLRGPAGAKVAAELKDGLKLTSFVAHPDVAEGEVTGRQELTFNIDTSSSPAQFQVNGKPYDPARMDRVLTLGGTDEWTLQSAFASHPFHIHINPFQVVRILDPAGKDVSAPGATDDAGGGAPDPQYPGLKGVWKDTLWVKSLVPPGQPPGAYTVVVRTRYQRYIGDFVLHCHILDHEDQGMMQNVRIALPEAPRGAAPPPP
jgi:L-ascorbate oxidase